jgi:glucose-6-phosphate 1-dehydrogenase
VANERAAVAARAERGPLIHPDAKPVGPAALVIFGATGDLTRRKLLPALYNLAAGHLLDERFAIVGIARGELDEAGFQSAISEILREFAAGTRKAREVDRKAIDGLTRRARFVSGAFEDPGTHARLRAVLDEVEREFHAEGNVLFYLATPPALFAPIVQQLGDAGLVREREGRWRRVIVEKPFGRDLESAVRLNQELRRVLREDQIWRIDHYLGKETVQNLLVFRFSNGMFEPIWNRRYIDSVQITVAEQIGVGTRGGYYESAGALRDMVPNHLLQLLSIVAMEPPTSFQADAVREEKAKVLRAIPPMTSEDVLTQTVRGQYGEGTVEGELAPAYRAEPRVAPDSRTETYAALELRIDNWRWAGVPFFLRTGKRLQRQVSEISIQFRRPPLMLFRDTQVGHLSRNTLVIRLQPEEGISLHFGAKIPGPHVRVGNVAMEFCYKDAFGADPSTGYETLLYDCMEGDATLFQSGGAAEACWAIVQPVLEVWSALPPRDFPNYPAGSWGPPEADPMLEREGRHWRRIEE